MQVCGSGSVSVSSEAAFRVRRCLHPNAFFIRPTFPIARRSRFKSPIDLAKQNQATLIVLHVVETLGAENVSYGEARSQLEPDSLSPAAHGEIQQIVPPAGFVDSGRACRGRRRTGRTDRSIRARK